MLPLDAPTIGVIETDDVDAQRQVLSGWDQDYAQLSAGQFHGRTTHMDFGGVRIFREQLSTRIEQVFVPPSGTVSFCLHLGPESLSRIAGIDVDELSFCILPGGRECHAVSDQESDVLCVQLAESLLPDDVMPGLVRARRPGVQLAERAPQMAWWLASVLDSCAAGRKRPLEGGDLEVLADLVVQGCCGLAGEGEEAARDRRGASFDLVMRAREIALEALPEVLEAGELAERLRVSVRLLEGSFRDIVGMGPASWLRIQRLNRAHRDLRASGDGVTVAEVATCWGFWHLGRFSGYYRDLFGCSPSETLQDGRC